MYGTFLVFYFLNADSRTICPVFLLHRVTVMNFQSTKLLQIQRISKRIPAQNVAL